MTDYNCENGFIMTLEPGLHELIFEMVIENPYGVVWQADPRFLPALRPTVRALQRSGCEAELYCRYGGLWISARCATMPPLGDGFTDNPEGW